MKILIWSQYFLPETFRINDVAVMLVKLGHEVTVLTGKPNYPEGKYYEGYRFSGIIRERTSGLDIVRIPLVNRGRSSFHLALNYLSFIFFGYTVAPWALSNHNFDLVFIYAPSPLFQALPALSLARDKRIPSVLWIQDLWPEVLLNRGREYNRYFIWLLEGIVRFIYNRSSRLLVQSEAFRPSVSRLVTDHSKIEYMPNPAEEPLARGVPSPRARVLADEMKGKFAVTFTGNIGKAQALGNVLEAAALLSHKPDICIYLIGSGSLSTWIEKEISQRGIDNVVLSERLPLSDMPLIMESSAALLASLSSDVVGETTIPSKIQSYLAAGRPIVASLNGEGARIVTTAGAGLACPAEKPDKLAEIILRLYETDEMERRQLGENGRNYYLGNFELSLLSRRLIEIFASLLDKTKDKME
jgi:glycosyltransferase involved in cell wall biosynthesis